MPTKDEIICESICESEARISKLMITVQNSGERPSPHSIRDELIYELGKAKGLKIARGIIDEETEDACRQ